MRRPVRTITLPPISSRRIRFGEPTSSRPSGVTVAAFSPRPCVGDRAGCLVHDAVRGLAPLASDRSKRGSAQLDADDVGLQYANGCLEQLLPRLVALEDDDRARVHDGGV